MIEKTDFAYPDFYSVNFTDIKMGIYISLLILLPFLHCFPLMFTKLVESERNVVVTTKLNYKKLVGEAFLSEDFYSMYYIYIEDQFYAHVCKINA